MAFVSPVYGFSLHYNTDGDGFADEPGAQNTWYTAVDHVGLVKLMYIAVYQKNDETNAKTVVVELTYSDSAGSHTLTSSGSLADDTQRTVFLLHDLNDDLNAFDLGYNDSSKPAFSDSANAGDQATAVGMKNLKVRFRQTDAAGTNQELNCAVIFQE